MEIIKADSNKLIDPPTGSIEALKVKENAVKNYWPDICIVEQKEPLAIWNTLQKRGEAYILWTNDDFPYFWKGYQVSRQEISIGNYIICDNRITDGPDAGDVIEQLREQNDSLYYSNDIYLHSHRSLDIEHPKISLLTYSERKNRQCIGVVIRIIK